MEKELANYPPILTAKQVSEILGVGRVKAYEIMKKNELKSFKVGTRNIRTTKQLLIDYINNKTNERMIG